MIYIFLQPILYISCRRQLTPSGSLRSPPTPETGVGKGCSDAVPFFSINLAVDSGVLPKKYVIILPNERKYFLWKIQSVQYQLQWASEQYLLSV